MDPILLAVYGTTFLIIMLLLRVPIAASLLGTGFIGLVLMTGKVGNTFSYEVGFRRAIAFISNDSYSFITSFTLIAVPMFLLMGNFAFYAKATTEAFETAKVWFSRVPGALALATIAACAMFAAMSGSSLANAAAMGKLAVPEMLKARYEKGLATGAVAAGGTLGALIPPSILIVIYGVFTEQSIGRLLIAGLPAGLLTAGLYMVMIYLRVRINPEIAPRLDVRYTWADKIKALNGTGQFILLFIVVMGSIYTGLATPTEASAVGALGMLVIGLARRKLDNQLIRNSFVDTLRQTSAIFAIAIGAKVYVAFIAFTQAAGVFAGWVSGLDLSPVALMFLLSIMYILLGMLMDPLGIMLLTLPVVVPIILDAGYDLIWFGIIMVKYLEIGMITPPVGLNVFVLKASIGNSVSLERIFKGVGWFLVMDIICLVVLIAFPRFITWLPEQIF